MDSKILLEVVTPEKLILSLEVDDLTAPGYEGEFGVLPGHTPFLAILKVGIISYKVGDGRRYIAAHGGYAEVGPKKVVILAERAEKAEDIDIERARAAKERAEQRLQAREKAEIDFERARVGLQRALVRLQVASRAPGR